MRLDPYVEAVQRQLAAAAETGGNEARALAAQLAAALEPAVRLALQDALALAVSEITCELAPGSVDSACAVGILSSWSPCHRPLILPIERIRNCFQRRQRSRRIRAQWTASTCVCLRG